MKIYYLSFSKIPSSDANSIHVMRMCEALAKNGHKIILFAKKNSDLDINPFSFYGTMKNFTLNHCSFPSFALIGDAIYGLDVLRKLFFSFTPDLYYGRHPHLMFFVSLGKTPMIYEAHDIPKTWLQRFIEGRILRSSNIRHLVVISNALKQAYLNIFPEIQEENIIVAHDGAIIPDTKNHVKPLPKRNKALQVGYTGSLYPGRGIEYIMRIAKKLPRVDFHVIGGTQKEISHYILPPNNLKFHGHVPHCHIQSYLTQFDILLAPYQKKVTIKDGTGDTSQWMSPLKIFEYMAAGKAIICSDIPVLREVLTHNETALLCSPNNVEEWVNAISTLSNDTEMRNKLGMQAQTLISETYSWDKRAKRVLL